MALSRLPLSYCTNVHPGLTVDQVLQGLRDYAAPARDQLGTPLAAGLWLARPVTEELLSAPHRVAQFRRNLEELQLACYTLNAFPYGNFHSERVKEQVYLPDWAAAERLDYTRQCAVILAELLPEAAEGSISTVPLGFKGLPQDAGFQNAAIAQLLELSTFLDTLYERTGKRIRLAIEPEPLCLLETTAETLDFFSVLRQAAEQAGTRATVDEYIGVCYDVCHQAVEFEDVSDSIRQLDAAGIRINKIHITCAVELRDPGANTEGREWLAEFVEPRYLHQTFARTAGGVIRSELDLNAALCADPPAEWRDAEAWRIHFHVPVHAESLGPLGTTRGDLRRALAEVARLEQTPHLEVETYTWSVMPGATPPPLAEALAGELTATRELLDEIAM